MEVRLSAAEDIKIDGFVQGIAGRQTAGRVLAHAPRNSTVEAATLHSSV
jgi:hypothetical protein